MQIFTIQDDSGLRVDLGDFGARIIGITLLQHGTPIQLACQYPSLAAYAQDPAYLGATIGPVANRVAQGKLRINNRHYQLPRNHGKHCLHSGGTGFDKMTWQCVSQRRDRVEFALGCGQEQTGLPGNLELMAGYSVANRQLCIDFQAVTDQATYLNMTNHVYLNLNGTEASVQNHRFTLYAGAYAELDNDNIPTGKRVTIPNPFDYSPTAKCDFQALQNQLDHHFIVNEDTADSSMKPFARIISPASGISLRVASNQPGFQLYTGQFLGAPFKPFAGFCIEPQFVPNAINQPEFSAPLTTPQAPYRHVTTLAFETTA